jgi:hypothetical protein
MKAAIADMIDMYGKLRRSSNYGEDSVYVTISRPGRYTPYVHVNEAASRVQHQGQQKLKSETSSTVMQFFFKKFLFVVEWPNSNFGP